MIVVGSRAAARRLENDVIVNSEERHSERQEARAEARAETADATTRRLERRLARERGARKAAEQLLEEKSRELFATNQQLRALAAELEERVAARTAELAEARDQAVEAYRLKGVFFASASHELRTPLNAILGYSELLIEEHEQGEPMAVGDVQNIRDSARHLLALINDVLDLSKIEAGRMEVVCEPFDVRALLEGVMTTMRPLADKRGNTLELRCPDVLPTLRSDSMKIRQILLNLLSNACKFTDAGTISLSASPYTEHGERWLAFTVKDTGIGIPRAALPRLFEAFSQASATTSRRFGGTGLGLAITWRLCRMLGGVIEVESQEGVGSEFTVRVPVRFEAEGWSQTPADADGQRRAG